MSGTTSRDSDKFMLRLPDGMRDRLKSAAAANNRSMNAEIVAAIELWLDLPSTADVRREDLERRVAMARERLHVAQSDLHLYETQLKDLLSELDKASEKDPKN